MGNDLPPMYIIRHGRRSCAANYQITREGGAINDICMVVLVPLLLFHCMPARRHSDSTPEAGAFVFTHDYRAVRTVQAVQPL